jgi:hypothetical protein
MISLPLGLNEGTEVMNGVVMDAKSAKPSCTLNASEGYVFLLLFKR